MNDKASVDNFIQNIVKSAFIELKKEFQQNGIPTEIHSLSNPTRIEITVQYDRLNNFLYGVKNQSQSVSNFVIEGRNLPDAENSKRYFPEAYFGDQREGYDIQYFTKNELISDVLKHYERYL